MSGALKGVIYHCSHPVGQENVKELCFSFSVATVFKTNIEMLSELTPP